jgi:hypothetical protein
MVYKLVYAFTELYHQKLDAWMMMLDDNDVGSRTRWMMMLDDDVVTSNERATARRHPSK